MEERLLALLRMALKQHATDLHFSIRNETVTLQMRRGLQIKDIETEPQDLKLFRYLQYRANLELSDRSRPQTGRFEIDVDGKILALRFAVMHSLMLTSGVLRILNGTLDWMLTDCCPDKKQTDLLKQVLKRRSGLFLVSGPTGSGKTTTLYAMLNELSPAKIFTLEDPIEIYSDRFIQIQINERQHLGYDEGISQLLRHDPDVIMIGEIREPVAAAMALRCALTGHLVLTSIHASSAQSAITRMIELGVSETQLMEMLAGVSCQRLVSLKNQKGRMCVYEVLLPDQLAQLRQGQLPDNFIPLPQRLDDLVLKNRITQKQREAVGL